MTGQQLVAEARDWRGTPFRHGARVKRVACDCVGLILGAAEAIGLTAWVPAGYAPEGDPERLREGLNVFCRQLSTGDTAPLECRQARAGDLLLLAFQGQAIHLAMASGEGTILHAWERAGQVVEHGFDPFWQSHCVGVWRWRAFDEEERG